MGKCGKLRKTEGQELARGLCDRDRAGEKKFVILTKKGGWKRREGRHQAAAAADALERELVKNIILPGDLLEGGAPTKRLNPAGDQRSGAR